MENMMLGLDFCEKNRRAEAVLRRQIRCIDMLSTAPLEGFCRGFMLGFKQTPQSLDGRFYMRMVRDK